MVKDNRGEFNTLQTLQELAQYCGGTIKMAETLPEIDNLFSDNFSLRDVLGTPALQEIIVGHLHVYVRANRLEGSRQSYKTAYFLNGVFQDGSNEESLQEMSREILRLKRASV